MAQTRLRFTVLSEALGGAQFEFVAERPVTVGRTKDNALVLDHKSVSRQHARIEPNGDIVLHAGDTLLLEAHPSFADQQRDRRDFYLVSRVEDSARPRYERAWAALGILAAMVAAACPDTLLGLLPALRMLALGTSGMWSCGWRV